jgi:molybdate transport system substrate-binding protein
MAVAAMGCVIVSFTSLAPALADDAVVAVAANFKDAMDRLEMEFESSSNHRLTVAIGSTGKLYAQIVNGAPFDAFLAADQERPKRLEVERKAAAGSRFTYAVGRLALWSADPAQVGKDGVTTLRAGAFRRLAIANPDLAPYGAAAMDVLRALELEGTLKPKLVMAENIGQTFAFIASGNAELGFVALSYVLSPQNDTQGSRWEVPAELHTPIRQDAVLLSRAAQNGAAASFLDFLKSAAARETIVQFGYGSD